MQFLHASTYLIDAKKHGNEFHFLFNKSIVNKDINYFKLLEKSSSRYIFNIKALKSQNISSIKDSEPINIRIAQFNKDTVRIVFENSEKLDLKYRLEKNKLIVKIDNLNKTTSTVKSNSTLIATTQIQNTNQNKLIVIDSGHGGKDPGTLYGKYQEKTVVLKVGLLLGDELKKKGYKVIYTRNKDTYLQLRDRTKIANDKGADVFISLHVNAAPKKNQYNSWQGIETYFLSPARSDRSMSVAELENQSDLEEMDYYSKQTFLNFLNREKIIASHKLAIDIQSFTLSSVKTKYKNAVDGGVREAPFWVLIGAQMPAILLEIGYITNASERERMFSENFQKLLASGIADGIEAYFEKNR